MKQVGTEMGQSRVADIYAKRLAGLEGKQQKLMGKYVGAHEARLGMAKTPQEVAAVEKSVPVAMGRKMGILPEKGTKVKPPKKGKAATTEPAPEEAGWWQDYMAALKRKSPLAIGGTAGAIALPAFGMGRLSKGDSQ